MNCNGVFKVTGGSGLPTVNSRSMLKIMKFLYHPSTISSLFMALNSTGQCQGNASVHFLAEAGKYFLLR